ncbi:MAG: CvpA family protein [Candidatus Eisenbacteria bacterium]|nr:CvpA family protein [Candidatus Eisenbacteria bacterium]
MATVIDVGLGLLLFLSIASGLRNGFLESVVSLLAWIAGLLAAFHGARPLVEQLPRAVQRVPGSEVLLGVLLFLVAFAALRVLGLLLGVSSGKPDGADRLLGGLLGVLRGLFLVAAIASLLVGLVPANRPILRESRALPLLAVPGRVIAHLAPPSLRERMEAGWLALARTREGPDGEPGASPQIPAEV